MLVTIGAIGTGLHKMNMFSVAHINCSAGFSTKFVVVTICKIGAKPYFMYMAATIWDCLTGYRCKPVVMAGTAFRKSSGVAYNFMDMMLL